MNMKELQEFVEDAKLGLATQEDIFEKRNELDAERDSINKKLEETESEFCKLDDDMMLQK